MSSGELTGVPEGSYAFQNTLEPIVPLLGVSGERERRERLCWQ